MKSNKDNLIEILKKRIQEVGAIENAGQKITEKQVAVLLGELQIAQIELEMRNSELTVSTQLLENERAKFASFFNLAPVGYFVLDHLGLIDEVNNMGTSLLNLTKEKIVTQRFQSFISPEDWENFYVFLHQMQPQGEKKSIEVKLSLKNGQEIYTRIEGIALVNSFTTKLQYYITVIDITKDKASQQILMETTQRLAMTLSASETGTWALDLASKQMFFDEFSLSLLELDDQNFDGNIHSFINCIHPDDRSLVKQSLMANSEELKKIYFNFKLFTKNGEFKYLTASGQVISNLKGSPYLAGVITDMSRIREIEQATLELQEEKQKLILATTFSAQEKERHKISSILHDSICQLLYGIRLKLQHSQHGNKAHDFEDIHQLLAQAIKETRALSYELTPSVLRDFGFTAGLREMVDRLNSPYFKINLQVNEHINSLQSDLQLSIFRIVQELLNNCLKHAEATRAEIMVQLKEQVVCIVVKDNGKGFSSTIENELMKGSGLRGIKNRVFLLNGELNMETGKSGSTITIKFKNDI